MLLILKLTLNRPNPLEELTTFPRTAGWIRARNWEKERKGRDGGGGKKGEGRGRRRRI